MDENESDQAVKEISFGRLCSNLRGDIKINKKKSEKNIEVKQIKQTKKNILKNLCVVIFARVLNEPETRNFEQNAPCLVQFSSSMFRADGQFTKIRRQCLLVTKKDFNFNEFFFDPAQFDVSLAVSTE